MCGRERVAGQGTDDRLAGLDARTDGHKGRWMDRWLGGLAEELGTA